MHAASKTRGTGEQGTATVELASEALLLCLHVCTIQSSTSSLDSFLQTYSGRGVAIRALEVSEAMQLRVALYWGSLLPAVSPLTLCFLLSISHPYAFVTSITVV